MCLSLELKVAYSRIHVASVFHFDLVQWNSLKPGENANANQMLLLSSQLMVTALVTTKLCSQL